MAGDLGALPALAERGERRVGEGEGDLVQAALDRPGSARSPPAARAPRRLGAVVAAGETRCSLPPAAARPSCRPGGRADRPRCGSSAALRRAASQQPRRQSRASRARIVIARLPPSAGLRPVAEVAGGRPAWSLIGRHGRTGEVAIDGFGEGSGRDRRRWPAALVLVAGGGARGGRSRARPAGLREGQLRRLPQVARRRRRRLRRRRAVAARRPRSTASC